MVILFDFEITETPIANTQKIKLITSELRDFVYQRLKVLETEINQYKGAITINLLGTIPGQFLVVNGFPEKLTMKVMESLTETDMIYVQDKILMLLENL